MACNCSVACTYFFTPVKFFFAYLLRGLVSVHVYFSRLLGGRFMSPNFPPDTTLVVPSTKGKRGIRVNVYKPPYMAELEAEKASEKQGKEERYPVHINLHGSGFVMNIMGSDGEFCRMVSKHTGAIVLDCDYAKAPEHPFPAAYEDVCDVVAHVLANKDGRYDTSRLTIGGFSAGGVLSLVVSATMPQGTFKAVTAGIIEELDMNQHRSSTRRQHRRKYVLKPGKLEICFALRRQ